MSSEEKINKQRLYWIDKAHVQLDQMMMLSLTEGSDNIEYDHAKEALDTSLLIISRFDKQLRRVRTKSTN